MLLLSGSVSGDHTPSPFLGRKVIWLGDDEMLELLPLNVQPSLEPRRLCSFLLLGCQLILVIVTIEATIWSVSTITQIQFSDVQNGTKIFYHANLVGRRTTDTFS